MSPESASSYHLENQQREVLHQEFGEKPFQDLMRALLLTRDPSLQELVHQLFRLLQERSKALEGHAQLQRESMTAGDVFSETYLSQSEKNLRAVAKSIQEAKAEIKREVEAILETKD